MQSARARARTVITYELLAYKKSNEWGQRTSEISDTLLNDCEATRESRRLQKPIQDGKCDTKTHSPLWLLIGRIIFLTFEKYFSLTDWLELICSVQRKEGWLITQGYWILSDLPRDGEVKFFKGNYLNYRYNNQSFSSISLFVRSTWHDFWATSTCLLQHARMASCKTDLSA